MEIKGEKPHGRKRLWRRYDASKPHRVTAIKSGIRVSLTAFRKANVSKEFRDQFLLDEGSEEEQEQSVNTLATDAVAADMLEAVEEEPPVAEEPPEEVLLEDEPIYVTSR